MAVCKPLRVVCLDRRNFQFLLAIFAIKVVCGGLNVVTRGIRSVDSLSLVCRNSSCVIVRTFSISRKTLVRWKPHATKKSAYSAIRFFSVSVEEHILLNLNAWLYGILCLRCGGCAKVQCRYGCVSVGYVSDRRLC